MEKLIKVRNAVRVLGIGTFMVVGLALGGGIAKADVSIIGGNSTTGPDSFNHNSWDINHDVSVNISNEASLLNDQSFCVDASIGNIDNNTVVGDITGGNVWGDIHVDNAVNNGDIHLMNPDPGNVSFDLGNFLTGPNSDNQNNVDISMNHNVDISNSANIDNNLSLSAMTGGLNIDHNTEVGNVRTGSVSFDANVNDVANQGAGNIDLGGLGGFGVNGSFSNRLTGPQSSNVNDVNLNSNSSIDVTNTSNINNNVDLSANTGGLNVNHNTVVGDVSTGNIHLNVSTTNRAN